MPCYQVILNKVDLSVANADVLMAALKGMEGLQLSPVVVTKGQVTFYYQGRSFTIKNGQLICQQGQEHVADKIKIAYSTEVMKRAGSRFGWANKTTGVNKGVLTRRA